MKRQFSTTAETLAYVVRMVQSPWPAFYVSAVLLWLLTREDSACSRKDALIVIGMHQQAFDKLIADLKTRGFVRIRQGEDRRRRCFCPTPMLLQLVEQAQASNTTSSAAA